MTRIPISLRDAPLNFCAHWHKKKRSITCDDVDCVVDSYKTTREYVVFFMNFVYLYTFFTIISYSAKKTTFLVISIECINGSFSLSHFGCSQSFRVQKHNKKQTSLLLLHPSGMDYTSRRGQCWNRCQIDGYRFHHTHTHESYTPDDDLIIVINSWC